MQGEGCNPKMARMLGIHRTYRVSKVSCGCLSGLTSALQNLTRDLLSWPGSPMMDALPVSPPPPEVSRNDCEIPEVPRVVSDMLCTRSGVYLGRLASKDWSEPPLYNLKSLSQPAPGPGQGAASRHTCWTPIQVLSAWGGSGMEPLSPLIRVPGSW